MNDTIPGGFVPLKPLDQATAPLGLYERSEEGHMSFGILVGSRHCNGGGHCHGGVLATLADVQLGANVFRMIGYGGPTISLTLDYLEGVPMGRWVEGRTELLKRGGRLAFMQCLLTMGGCPVVRASGTFRLYPSRPRSTRIVVNAAA
jgi:acyl-coenzyme A thioesterase PaaI-like protein